MFRERRDLTCTVVKSRALEKPRDWAFWNSWKKSDSALGELSVNVLP